MADSCPLSPLRASKDDHRRPENALSAKENSRFLRCLGVSQAPAAETYTSSGPSRTLAARRADGAAHRGSWLPCIGFDPRSFNERGPPEVSEPQGMSTRSARGARSVALSPGCYLIDYPA